MPSTSIPRNSTSSIQRVTTLGTTRFSRSQRIVRSDPKRFAAEAIASLVKLGLLLLPWDDFRCCNFGPGFSLLKKLPKFLREGSVGFGIMASFDVWLYGIDST